MTNCGDKIRLRARVQGEGGEQGAEEVSQGLAPGVRLGGNLGAVNVAMRSLGMCSGDTQVELSHRHWEVRLKSRLERTPI